MNTTATMTALAQLVQDRHIDYTVLYHMISEGLESERIKLQTEQILGNVTAKTIALRERRIVQAEGFLSLMRLARLNGGS